MEERKKKTGEKKRGGGRDVSPFSLIHYLASYLGGLSGQSETVSCRLGKGVRWSADNEPLAHCSQKFHIIDWRAVGHVVFHFLHISHLDSSRNFFFAPVNVFKLAPVCCPAPVSPTSSLRPR